MNTPDLVEKAKDTIVALETAILIMKFEMEKENPDPRNVNHLIDLANEKALDLRESYVGGKGFQSIFAHLKQRKKYQNTDLHTILEKSHQRYGEVMEAFSDLVGARFEPADGKNKILDAEFLAE